MKIKRALLWFVHLEQMSLKCSSSSFVMSQSSLPFTIVSPLWFIISLMFFYHCRYYFQVSFNLEVILYEAKITPKHYYRMNETILTGTYKFRFKIYNTLQLQFSELDSGRTTQQNDFRLHCLPPFVHC